MTTEFSQMSAESKMAAIQRFYGNTIWERMELVGEPCAFIQEVEKDHEHIAVQLVRYQMIWGQIFLGNWAKTFILRSGILGGASYLLYRVSYYSPRVRHITQIATHFRGAYMLVSVGVVAALFFIFIQSYRKSREITNPQLNANYHIEVEWTKKWLPQIQKRLNILTSNDALEKEQLERLQKIFEEIQK